MVPFGWPVRWCPSGTMWLEEKATWTLQYECKVIWVATFLFGSWTFCSIQEVYGKGKQPPLFCCLPFLPLQNCDSDRPISDGSSCSFSLPASDISAHLGRGWKCRLFRPGDLERRSDHAKNTLQLLPHPPFRVPSRFAARRGCLPVTKKSAYFLSSIDYNNNYLEASLQTLALHCLAWNMTSVRNRTHTNFFDQRWPNAKSLKRTRGLPSGSHWFWRAMMNLCWMCGQTEGASSM